MFNHKTKTGIGDNKYITTKLTGDALLNTPHLNKGTAFTQKERKYFKLLGKLPFNIEALNQQVKRTHEQFQSYTTPKHKNTFLHELYNTNRILFYKLLENHAEEMIPIIYTPHIATYCQTFSHEFCRPQGLYISYQHREHLAEIISNNITPEIELVVVTDGERVLGIGDQGVGGIGIPIGKLILYSLLGRVDPKKTLPIVLDVGTNNKTLLNDPLYLGWRHRRISGTKYNNFLDKFVKTLKRTVPNVFLHWEDFGRTNALPLLNHYRRKICSFNDDIQGTAVVTLAAILAALKISKQKLAEQRIVILGAGSAALGIAELIVVGMQRAGLTKQEAKQNFWLVDYYGLITENAKNINANQKSYVRKTKEVKSWLSKNHKHISLLEVVKNVKPTILIGCSTAAGSFTKEIVQEMTKYTKHPIIFPLSNPTTHSEATPKDLLTWTKGKALVATGSPFAPVIYKNKKYTIAQCNNALAFPGIGLGVITSKAKMVTDEMLWNAVDVIYREAPCSKDSTKPLLPLIKDATKIAQKIAIKVATIAIQKRLSTLPLTTNISHLVTKNIWKIKYSKLALTK